MTRIKVTVDGNELYEYMDFALTFKEGHFAFQQHDPGIHPGHFVAVGAIDS